MTVNRIATPGTPLAEESRLWVDRSRSRRSYRDFTATDPFQGHFARCMAARETGAA
jgi:hypothetical protein